MNAESQAALKSIDRLVADFFAAVSFEPGQPPALTRLRELCLPQALLIQTGGADAEAFTLEGFIASRRARHAEGSISRYRVTELRHTTERFNGIAHRASAFARLGVKDGEPFEVRGMIFFQCVETAAGWRISAAAWTDQRPGQPLSSHPEPTEFG